MTTELDIELLEKEALILKEELLNKMSDLERLNKAQEITESLEAEFKSMVKDINSISTRLSLLEDRVNLAKSRLVARGKSSKTIKMV